MDGFELHVSIPDAEIMVFKSLFWPELFILKSWVFGCILVKHKVLLTWNLQLWRGYGRQLVFGVLDKSHSRNKIFHFYFFFFPPLYLPFDALEMPRESEKKCFLFHIAQLLHCWRKNILNINTALGLKAFLKRHFNAMTFSKVNSHKNQVKDQNPFCW